MNVLFLTHRLPYAPNRGDRYRAYHLLEALSRFSDVTLYSLVHDADEERHAQGVPFATRVVTSRVNKARNVVRGAARWFTKIPLTHSLLDAPDVHVQLEQIVSAHRPDVVVAFCSGMARLAMQPPLSDFPLVFDLVDVDSQKWLELAQSASPPRKWIYSREASTLGAFEAEAANRAVTTLVVNDREKALTETLATGARVLVLRNGVDVDGLRPISPPAADAVVVFCGVMNYRPNEEGVCWFAKEIWPRVLSVRPDARFRIVGSSPTDEVRSLSAVHPSIEVVGAVPAVQPFLHGAAVSVAPLRVARGVQNKVLEAVAAGLPVVVTPAVAAGLPSEVRSAVASARSAEQFAGRLIELLQMPAEMRSGIARSCDLGSLRWINQTAPLQAIIEQAVKSGRSGRLSSA